MNNEKNKYAKLDALISWQLATHPCFGVPKRRGRKPKRTDILTTSRSYNYKPHFSQRVMRNNGLQSTNK